MLLQDEVARLFQTLFEIRYEPCTVYKYVFRLNDKFIVANYRLSFYEDQTYDYFYHMIVYQCILYKESLIFIRQLYDYILAYNNYVYYILTFYYISFAFLMQNLTLRRVLNYKMRNLLFQTMSVIPMRAKFVKFVVTKCSFHIIIIRLYNRGAKMYDYFIL